MNINKKQRRELSMFMVNVSAKLLAPLRAEHAECSVLDLKARYRGVKYLRETLYFHKNLIAIVIDQILGAIGAIHYKTTRIRPG